jgi:hypothetical protein
MKFIIIITMFICVILVTLLAIVEIRCGTFGCRCIDYKGSAYEVCLIRLSKGGSP